MKKFQTYLLGIFAFFSIGHASAQTWTPVGTPASWENVASSADGRKLIATGQTWIYATSTNYGSTWTTNTEPQFNQLEFGSYWGSWSGIGSSADGDKLAAIVGTVVWISTDSGNTWVSNNVPGADSLSALAWSADGNKLVVADGRNQPTGLIYTSTNSGITLIYLNEFGHHFDADHGADKLLVLRRCFGGWHPVVRDRHQRRWRGRLYLAGRGAYLDVDLRADQ
jgi:hypothetical protein